MPAQGPEPQLAQNLKRLSIEELTQLDITTASRRVEPLARVAAAVSVIRGEDIRRAGVANLAEALRLADGIAVARADNETWAISTRGFNISTANKILVLIDGRTVYSPLFAGTFWSVQDVPLDGHRSYRSDSRAGRRRLGRQRRQRCREHHHQERGRHEGRLQVLLAAGTEERAIATVQYGGDDARRSTTASTENSARATARCLVDRAGRQRRRAVRTGRLPHRVRGGRRAMAGRCRATRMAGREGLFNQPDTHVSGIESHGPLEPAVLPHVPVPRPGLLRPRLPPGFQPAARRAQHLRRRPPAAGRRAAATTSSSAAAFRASRGDDAGNASFHFDPQARLSTLGGLFAQDEIALVPDRLALIAGAKFERNTFTGFETQPSVRVRWTPSARRTIWGAVSRAVRLPTRFDTDLRFTNPATGAVTLTGTNDFDTEKVTAYEAGYRAEVSPRLSVDVSGTRTCTTDLRSEEFPTRAGEPIVLANLMNARTWGTDVAGEPHAAAAVAAARRRTRYLHETITFDPGSRDPTKGVNEYNDPSHVFKLRSNVDLPRGIELDAFIRRVGRLPHPVVPGYAELDARIGWHPTSRWELSLIGQNLLHAHHPEFQLASPTARGIPARRVRARWCGDSDPRPVSRGRGGDRGLLADGAGGAARRAAHRHGRRRHQGGVPLQLHQVRRVAGGRRLPSERFRLCTVADPAFNTALDRTLAGETVDGRADRAVEPRDARRGAVVRHPVSRPSRERSRGSTGSPRSVTRQSWWSGESRAAAEQGRAHQLRPGRQPRAVRHQCRRRQARRPDHQLEAAARGAERHRHGAAPDARRSWPACRFARSSSR